MSLKWYPKRPRKLIKTKTKDSGYIENRKGMRTVMDDILEDADRANRERNNPFKGERFAYLSQSHVREDRISETRVGKEVARQDNNRSSRRP
jgi:hypothetical protein